jgi:integrase
MTKRPYGDGGIDSSGDVHRLRYRINGKRFRKTIHGSLTEAKKELRRLIKSGDVGEHVEPDKITVAQWIDQWIKAGAPGRKKKKVGQRTLERYEELLRVHVKPKLGARPLQKLAATEIDELYVELETKMAPMTLHHVHVTFNSCLSTAERKGLLVANPMRRAEQVPSPGESDHGVALDEPDLAKLVTGFKPSTTMYAPVAVDAATGARRNELLAFRWTDHNPEKKTLRVERALEVTKKFGMRFKPPKTKRGLRTIALDDGTNAILLKEKQNISRSVPAFLTAPKLTCHWFGCPRMRSSSPPSPGQARISRLPPHAIRGTSARSLLGAPSGSISLASASIISAAPTAPCC